MVIRKPGCRETTDMPEFLVGVERAPTLADPAATLAHAVPEVGDATRLGVALCGMPVEGLTLRPDLAWLDTGTHGRCEHCQRAWSN